MINHKQEQVFFRYAVGIQILYPQSLVKRMKEKLQKAAEQYK